MALLKCTECGHQVSDRAIECPECGCPVSEILLDIKENEMFEKLDAEQGTLGVSEKFKKDINEYPLSDLKFMRDTQQELYSKEEMQYICKVIKNRQMKEEEEKGYGFHYAISFLIPLVGFIIGSMMLSKNNSSERECGKTCIGLGVASIILYVVLGNVFF